MKNGTNRTLECTYVKNLMKVNPNKKNAQNRPQSSFSNERKFYVCNIYEVH